MIKKSAKTVFMVLLSLVIVCCASLFAACGADNGNKPEDKTVSVTVEPKTLTMQTGDDPIMVRANVNNEPEDEDVLWQSSDTSIVTVNPNGRVTAVSAGTATVTASIAGVSDTCEVTVLAFNPAIELSKTELSVLETESKTVTAVAKSHGRELAGVTYTWISSDKEIATVKDGEIKGVNQGTATITVVATTADGRVDVSATINVIVIEKTVSFKLNRMIPNGFDAEGKVTYVKDGETEDVTVKAGDDNILNYLWTYKGMIISTDELNSEGFTGFNVADDGSTVINAYYQASAPIENTDGKAFFMYTTAKFPMHIGSYGMTFETVDYAEKEGVTKVTSLESNGTNKPHLRLVGIDKDQITEKGYERLSFEIYIDSIDANPVIVIDSISTAASLWSSGDMSKVSNIVKVLDADGNPQNVIKAGEWNTVIVILDKLTSADAFAFPAMGLQFRQNSGQSVYISNAKLFVPDYKEYTVEYYFETGKETGVFEKNAEYSGVEKGIVGETATIDTMDFDNYILDTANENNLLSAPLNDDGTAVVLKAYYKYADPTSYKVEYYKQKTDSTEYELFETVNVNNVFAGRIATAEIKDYDGYVYSMRNTAHHLTETIAEDGSTVLKVYYDLVIKVAAGDGYNGYLGGELTDAKVVKSNDIENGDNDVYSFTITATYDNIRLVYLGTKNTQLDGYGMLSLKLYITEDFKAEAIYFAYKKLENNVVSRPFGFADLMEHKENIRVLNAEGARIYNLTGVSGWITVQYNLANIDNYGIADTVNTRYTNLGVNIAIYPSAKTNNVNLNKPLYISEVKLEQNFAMPKADYNIEYYFENDAGEYVKDETKTLTLTAEVGDTVIATAEQVEDFVIDATKGVNSGVVKADESLVLSVYYSKIRYANYTVNYYKQQADGSYAIDESATETLKGAIGANVTATIKSFEGYALNTGIEDAVTSATVNEDGSTVLKLYYGVSVPIANTNGKGSLYTFLTSGVNKSGLGGTFEKVGEYQGLTDVYKFTQTLRRYYTAIVGINKDYLAESGYKYLVFNMFAPTNTNIVMQLNNGKGNIFSMHVANEVAKNGTGASFYDMATGEKLSAFVYGAWNTVVIDLTDMLSADNFNVPRLFLQIGTEVNAIMFFRNMTLINEAEYKTEYYFEKDGEYVKDEAKTSTLKAIGGLTVNAETPAYEGYSVNTEFSTLKGVVNGDGSLTLKVYYKTAEVTTYKVEYYFRNNAGEYVKNEDLTQTIYADAGESVKAEIKSFEGYVYSMRNPIQELKGTVADDNSTVLKVYYDNGALVYDESGKVVATFAGELYGAKISDEGTSVKVGDTTIENGGKEIYEYTFGSSSTEHTRLMPFGITRANTIDAGYKKLTLKVYVTADVNKERLYEYLRYDNNGTKTNKEFIINNNNLAGNNYVRVFDKDGTRVTSFDAGYEGWITIEMLVGSTIDGYGIADTVNDATAINIGIYLAFYTNATNYGKTIYLSEITFSTNALSDSLAK